MSSGYYYSINTVTIGGLVYISYWTIDGQHGKTVFLL